MRRFAIAVGSAVVGYVVGAVLGYALVQGFSANQHDREMEALMTGAFAAGPLVAVVAAIAGAVLGGSRSTRG